MIFDRQAVASALRSAFTHWRGACLDEREIVGDLYVELVAERAAVVTFGPIEEAPTAKDGGRAPHFDVWGRTWDVRTDSMIWERFPRCYMGREGPSIGAAYVVQGLPDYARSYKLVYFATIAEPPQ